MKVVVSFCSGSWPVKKFFQEILELGDPESVRWGLGGSVVVVDEGCRAGWGFGWGGGGRLGFRVQFSVDQLIVCVLNLLECPGITTQIGVMFFGFLTIGSMNFVRRSILGNAKDFSSIHRINFWS